jgi:soluble lytic murein transglycosylase
MLDRGFGVRVRGLAVAGAMSVVCLAVAPAQAVIARTTPPAPSNSLTAGELWLAPASARQGSDALAAAVADLDNGRPSRALPVFTKYAADAVIGPYVRVYEGRANLALNYPKAAAAAADKAAAHATGYLRQTALLLLADADQNLGDNAASVRALQAIIADGPLNPEPVYMRLGDAANGSGDRALALKSWRTVYDDYPLSDQADDAATLLTKYAPGTVTPSIETLGRDVARAEQLYDSKRFTDAKKAFTAIRNITTGDDRDRADLRVAECDQQLKHTSAAIDSLKALLAKPTPREPETRYFYLSALRDLGHGDEYIALANQFVDGNPADPLAETTLFDLSQYFTRKDDDARAAATAADLVRRFPNGPHADKMAWRAGWWAYKNGDFATTIATFSTAATTFRHADLRPAWLYWTARANDRLNDREASVAGFRQCIADYRNTYYGREAQRELTTMHVPVAAPPSPVTLASRAGDPPHRVEPSGDLAPGPVPTNASVIRALLAAGLFDDAIGEIKVIERASGPTPILEATVAYALNRKGDLRPGIQTMRRAYPQFMTAGGELMPNDLLTVIFPVAYWDLIRKYADAHKLDPYIMAALIAQESTFEAGVKSAANAWGLMQVLPSTGREYAHKLGIAPFRTSRLTDPETNIRIGMAMFADLMSDLGDLSLALAAYNAGEDRASHWKAARQGVARDEFIDDIPYAETQNYVKRIIGTAEDYRRLYPAGKTSSTVAR